MTCIRVKERPDLIESLRSESAANPDLVALSSYMTAAGNEVRMGILFSLWRAGELCVCDLADVFTVSAPAMSRHLRILREKGLVSPRKDAQTVYYRLNRDNPFAALVEDYFERRSLAQITLNPEIR